MGPRAEGSVQGLGLRVHFLVFRVEGLRRGGQEFRFQFLGLRV